MDPGALGPKTNGRLSTGGRFPLETRGCRRDNRRWSFPMPEDTGDGHPAQQSADGVRRGKDIPPRKVGYPMLPERCSWRIGEARLQGFTPLENPYPSRCGLDSVRADALMGFRLLRDFSPGPARNAFAPSTSTSFAALLTRRS
jgi:hypothetical protein